MKTTNGVFTVVCLKGPADAMSLSEGNKEARKSFSTKRAALSYAAARVKRGGGYHAACVFEAKGGEELWRLVGERKSFARRRYLNKLAIDSVRR